MEPTGWSDEWGFLQQFLGVFTETKFTWHLGVCVAGRFDNYDMTVSLIKFLSFICL